MTSTPSETRKRNRLRRLCQILAVIAAVWAVVTVARAFRSPPSLDLARSEVAAGHFDAAIGHYLDHLARDPEDWSARLELGMVLSEVDQPQALVEYRKIPPQTEEREYALRQIAAICLSTERYDEAEEALLELERQTPNDGASQLALAELYFRRGNAKTALPYAQKSAELNPTMPRAHSLLAEVYDELNRPAEMVEPLHRLLELQPDDYGANLNLSYAYAEAGNAGRSRHHAEWCMKKNPSDVNARRFFAMALRDEGQPDEALLEVERALELAPGDLELRLLEAELLLFFDRAEEAFTRLQPFGDSFPSDRRVAALLARSAAAAGKSDEAEKYRKLVQKLTE